jgi:hypothetical protein
MSYKPTIQSVGQSDIRCRPLTLLAALSACLFFHAYFIPFLKCSLPHIAQPTIDMESAPWPSSVAADTVVLPFHHSEIPHALLILASDSVARVETEDLDSFEEDPGHPQAISAASLISLGELCSHDSPRPPLLPFLANHGLMSRRF